MCTKWHAIVCLFVCVDYRVCMTAIWNTRCITHSFRVLLLLSELRFLSIHWQTILTLFRTRLALSIRNPLCYSDVLLLLNYFSSLPFKISLRCSVSVVPQLITHLTVIIPSAHLTPQGRSSSTEWTATPPLFTLSLVITFKKIVCAAMWVLYSSWLPTLLPREGSPLHMLSDLQPLPPHSYSLVVYFTGCSTKSILMRVQHFDLLSTYIAWLSSNFIHKIYKIIKKDQNSKLYL